MGTFHVGCLIVNHVERNRTARVPKLLVDAGSGHTWISGDTLEKIGVAPLAPHPEN